VWVVAALGALALPACGGDDDGPDPSTVHQRPAMGYSLTIPEGWRRADRPVDRKTTNPREVVVIATFDVPRREGGGCGPFYDHALDHMEDDEGFVAIRERLGNEVAGPPDFPDRPVAFELRPAKPEPGGCRAHGRRSFRRWWIPFEDRGRDFYAQVGIGVDAPDSIRRDAESALNGFRVD
jgi:hypothetical protein